uniref:Uncharacterized protein n=1 Tax=Arundo donax TaxID=35708 RepID=A0A0A9FIJ3_ARUDO
MNLNCHLSCCIF